jgi:hypothetical protein
MHAHNEEQGKNMTDTIELLETIGANASLRRASAEELAHALEQAGATDVLKAAAKAGDSSLLSGEFGHKPMRGNVEPHSPFHPGKEKEPSHEPGKDDPHQPSKPDKGESPRHQ